MANNLVGQIVADQFRVDAFISSGGMGTVFRVWDLKRNVPLAMKVLHADLAEDQIIFERFKREARALRKLEHPNIVPFYGLYETSSLIFLLQRFIDGPTLKDVISQRSQAAFSDEDVLCIMKALCSAVGYAHNNNVIHCDIKSANVMVDRGGHIYLSDFGIARHAESDVTAMPGAGTPAYMAPEQILSKTVSRETDIYAIGVLLFELLTGVRPFRGSENGLEQTGNTVNERVRYAHLHLPAPDPRQFNPTISPSLSAIVLKALEKEPSARFSSCQELFSALCEVLDTFPELIPDQLSQNTQAPVPAMQQPPQERMTDMSPYPTQNANSPQNIPRNTQSPVKKWIFPVLIGVIVVLIGALIIPSLLKLNSESSDKPGDNVSLLLQKNTQSSQYSLEDIVATSISLTQTAGVESQASQQDATDSSSQAGIVETPGPNLQSTTETISTEDPAKVFSAAESAIHANKAYWSLYNQKKWVVYNQIKNPLFLSPLGQEKPKNFVLQTLFTNPPSFSKDETWELGVVFRYVDQENYYVLRFLSNFHWYLENCAGDAENCSVIDEGTISINVDPSGQNMLKLLVHGTTGYVYFRGQYINDLDLSARTNEGRIYVYTLFDLGDVRDGYTIFYDKLALKIIQ